MSANPDEFSFFEHFNELRWRLIKSLAAVAVAACLFYPFVDPVLAFLIRPVGRVVFTSPSDAFVARFMLVIWGGVILALPVILFQFWRFVSAGLKGHERKYVALFGPLSLVLFFAGAAFGYFVMIPVGMKFLLGFATDFMVPMITVQNYLSFVTTLVLAFGATFELPLILMFLAKIGIVTPAFLAQKRKHAVVIILIVSAVITPPDAVSQLIMALPLVVLYELGIIVSRLVQRPA